MVETFRRTVVLANCLTEVPTYLYVFDHIFKKFWPFVVWRVFILFFSLLRKMWWSSDRKRKFRRRPATTHLPRPPMSNCPRRHLWRWPGRWRHCWWSKFFILFLDCYLIKAELLKEGIFFLIHLFARDISLMKKLEIKKTKFTFIISVLKVEY